MLSEEIEAYDAVLNIIDRLQKENEEKDKEIEKYKYLYKEALGDVIKKNENEILGIARELAKLIDGTDEEILSVIRKYYEILKVDVFENKAKKGDEYGSSVCTNALFVVQIRGRNVYE